MASVYRGEQFCLNILYRINGSNTSTFSTLHTSDDPKEDMIDVPVEVKPKEHKATDQDRNPFNKHKEPEPPAEPVQQTKKQLCLIPFHLWQERDVALLDSYFGAVKQIRTVVNEQIFNTNAKKECEADPYGIYHNELCHYYMALKRLCLKVKLSMNEQQPDQIDKVYYEAGCFENDEASLFQNTQVGQYYDYGHEVAVEVRSNEDPYMVFSYSKYNLGTDFTLFLYLSAICGIMSTWAFCHICYMFCCKLERKPDSDSTTVPRSAGNDLGQFDQEMAPFRAEVGSSSHGQQAFQPHQLM